VKRMTLYEQLGIVIPGSVFVFGLMFFFPSLRELLAKDGISLGQLGIFVLLSYAAGHLIAAVGNVGETLLWRLAGGMPTDWVTKPHTKLISQQQREQVESKVRSRLGLSIEKLSGMDRKIWWPISRQIYSDVERHGKPSRIDSFNGNYGLNRGLASASLVLTCVAAGSSNLPAAGLLLFLSIVYTYRAYRFGVHYGRELYIQFLTISETPPKSPPKRKEVQDKA
jgi:hypothetical protein